MKKTIKEDKERIIIKEEFINDNTLLEYVKEDNNVIIGIYDKSFTKNGAYTAIFGLDMLEHEGTISQNKMLANV